MSTRTTAAALALAGLAGCASCDTVPSGAVTDCDQRIVPGGAATDILFVIDDSGSMTEEQDELARYLGAFIDQLLASAIALDLQIGVTNTSVEEYALSPTFVGTVYGRLPGFPGAPGTPYPQGTLVAIDQDPQGVATGHFTWGTAYDDPAHLTSTWGGPRLLASRTSTAADLARDFRANVAQGVSGSSREQPLSAMRRALEKASCPGPNCGFLRAGARLAVVILTDEDDCSGPREAGPGAVIIGDTACHDPRNWGHLDPLADFVSYLDSTVGGQPVVGVIAGYDGDPLAPAACNSAGNTTSARAAPNRLDAFVDLLDPARTRTVKASICRPFSEALLRIADTIIPQTMPLRQSPADYRMMVVSVQKAAGAVQPCQIEPADSANAGSAGVIYTPAPAGGLPSLTFQGVCRLAAGDKVDLKIVCAR